MRVKLFFALLAATLLAGCSLAPEKPTTTPSKPLLLVTIPPYQALVQKIAGETFEVRTVVPPHADPHSYEPTSKQAAQLMQGQIWFQIGEPFEKKLTPLLHNTSIVDLRRGVAMIEGHHACGHCDQDRHVWLSPSTLAVQASSVARVLQERFPAEREGIAARLVLAQEELRALHRDVEKVLHGVQQRSFVVAHPAFAYFCRDYQCQQLPIEQEGKEPRPQELELLLEWADSQQAEVAISMPQHSSRGTEAVAAQLQIPVKIIDPYAFDYDQTLRALAKAIADPHQRHAP